MLELCHELDGQCAVASDDEHFITVGDAREASRRLEQGKHTFSRRRIVKVKRNQVLAARLKVKIDEKQGRKSEPAVLKIASVRLPGETEPPKLQVEEDPRSPIWPWKRLKR